MDRNTRIAAAVLMVAVPGMVCGVEAQVVRQLTDVRSQTFRASPSSLDDAGTVLFFSSSSESFGVLADGQRRIVRFDTATDGGSPLFPFVTWPAPSVRDDGAWIAFVSADDPAGDNPDGSQEVFLASVDGVTVRQLTDFSNDDDVDVTEVVLAGSGNRVAFLDDDRLFVVDADGTNLRPLTPEFDDHSEAISISDDGMRLVFLHRGDPFGTNLDHQPEVFAVLADGTSLRQLTFGQRVDSAVLSGDGSRVAASISMAGSFVYVMDWDGSGFTEVGRGTQPSLTDDGRDVVYTGSESGPRQVLRKDLMNVGPPVPLTFDPEVSHSRAVVSGDGNRIVYQTFNTSLQLNLMNGNGTDKRRVGAHTPAFYVEEPDIAAGGSRITFSTNADLTGANHGYNYQVFRIESDGSDLAQVTSLTEPSELAWHPRITGEGEELIFMSYSDLTGVDQDGFQKTFRVAADGSGLIQLSAVGDLGEHADVADDGSLAVLQEWNGLARATLDGSELTPILPTFWGSLRAHPRIDATGTWVAFSDFSEVYRVSTDGAVFEQITTDGGAYPAISGDGARIAFQSSGDPLGTNPDGNSEVFVLEPATATLRQLTEAPDGWSGTAAIDADGDWIYFKSEVRWTDPGPFEPGLVDLFRVPATGGTIERVGGLGGGGSSSGGGRKTTMLEVDGTGRRAVIAISADWTGQNVDRNAELFLVDFTTAARIFVGQAAPTVVRWDVEAGPLTYDVIRGDVANLSGSVDLGPVVCLENDSTGNTTVGWEDAEQPGPGQTFFFLYRGSQGALSGPGSWGAGTAGERTAVPGRCD